MFEGILLEPEQKGLLSILVEAARNVPRDQRQKFRVTRNGRGIEHPGLPGGSTNAYFGDIEVLAKADLLNLMSEEGLLHGPTMHVFAVTPRGFAYYEEMERSSGKPVQHVEAEVRSYLDAQAFQERYPAAYEKWAGAEEKLWGSDSQRELTTIGHLCKEAMEEFATALVERYQPPDVDQDKTHEINRVRAVLTHLRGQASEKVVKLLDALSVYWEAVSGLVQRQRHGAQKEGEPLVWEDARRLVFQTVIVMFELDRSLASVK